MIIQQSIGQSDGLLVPSLFPGFVTADQQRPALALVKREQHALRLADAQLLHIAMARGVDLSDTRPSKRRPELPQPLDRRLDAPGLLQWQTLHPVLELRRPLDLPHTLYRPQRAKFAPSIEAGAVNRGPVEPRIPNNRENSSYDGELAPELVLSPSNAQLTPPSAHFSL
jgi:hypothetical protein